MDDNIPGGDFLGGNFPGGVFQGEVLWMEIFRVGIFSGGVFVEPMKIYQLYVIVISSLSNSKHFIKIF